MSKYEGERVLVVPLEDRPNESSELISSVSNFEFIDREIAEEPGCGYVQLIPYIVVMDSDNRVFCYTRLSEGSEKRLEGKLSIGIGGHINPVDQFMAGRRALSTIITYGANREVAEELDIDFEEEEDMAVKFGLPVPWPAGTHEKLIYDPSNDVGKVHLGVPMYIVCNSATVKETDKLHGEYVDLDELSKMDNLETWSEILVKRLTAL